MTDDTVQQVHHDLQARARQHSARERHRRRAEADRTAFPGNAGGGALVASPVNLPPPGITPPVEVLRGTTVAHTLVLYATAGQTIPAAGGPWRFQSRGSDPEGPVGYPTTLEDGTFPITKWVADLTGQVWWNVVWRWDNIPNAAGERDPSLGKFRTAPTLRVVRTRGGVQTVREYTRDTVVPGGSWRTPVWTCQQGDEFEIYTPHGDATDQGLALGIVGQTIVETDTEPVDVTPTELWVSDSGTLMSLDPESGTYEPANHIGLGFEHPDPNVEYGNLIAHAPSADGAHIYMVWELGYVGAGTPNYWDGYAWSVWRIGVTEGAVMERIGELPDSMFPFDPTQRFNMTPSDEYGFWYPGQNLNMVHRGDTNDLVLGLFHDYSYDTVGPPYEDYMPAVAVIPLDNLAATDVTILDWGTVADHPDYTTGGPGTGLRGFFDYSGHIFGHNGDILTWVSSQETVIGRIDVDTGVWTIIGWTYPPRGEHGSSVNGEVVTFDGITENVGGTFVNVTYREVWTLTPTLPYTEARADEAYGGMRAANYVGNTERDMSDFAVAVVGDALLWHNLRTGEKGTWTTLPYTPDSAGFTNTGSPVELQLHRDGVVEAYRFDTAGTFTLDRTFTLTGGVHATADWDWVFEIPNQSVFHAVNSTDPRGHKYRNLVGGGWEVHDWEWAGIDHVVDVQVPNNVSRAGVILAKSGGGYSVGLVRPDYGFAQEWGPFDWTDAEAPARIGQSWGFVPAINFDVSPPMPNRFRNDALLVLGAAGTLWGGRDSGQAALYGPAWTKVGTWPEAVGATSLTWLPARPPGA